MLKCVPYLIVSAYITLNIYFATNDLHSLESKILLKLEKHSGEMFSPYSCLMSREGLLNNNSVSLVASFIADKLLQKFNR